MKLARSLGFTSDGGTAAIASDGGLHLADVGGGRPPAFHSIAEIVDIAAVGSELWIAAERGAKLIRIGADYRVHEQRALWGGDGVLRPCATGEPGALWSAEPPAVVRASGDLHRITVPAGGDCVIAVSSTRWITCRRDRVQLRDPGTERWAVTIPVGAGRVVDGAVLFDGRTVALVIAALDGSLAQILVLSLHDGALQHRVTIAGIDLVRFATIRGVALMRSDAHVLTLFDLRFGQVLKERREEHAIVDFAIDARGRSFMTRFGAAAADVSIGNVADWVTQTTSAPAPVDDNVANLAPAVAPPDESPTAGEPPKPYYRGEQRLGAVRMLAPRVTRTLASAPVARAVFESYRELVSALAGAAISRAWDEGRLSATIEGGLPFHAEVEGLRGRASGLAPDDVIEATREVDDALAHTKRQEATLGGALSPLAALAVEFGLSADAQLILLVVAAPSLWGELARLYGILANDPARPLVDELLVGAVLASVLDRYDLARELDRDAPLIRYGLVRLGQGRMRPFLPLACDRVVLRMLSGADPTTELDNIRIVDASVTFDDLLVAAAAKDEVARALADAPLASTGRIVIRGRTGAGRHTLLASLAQAAGRRLAVIDALPIMRDLRRRAPELGIALLRANLVGLLPCVDGLEAMPADDPGARDLIRQVLDDHPGLLAVRLPWDSEPPLAAGYLMIDLPPLTMSQRVESWRVLVAKHALSVRDPDELADRFHVGPGVIAKVCTRVAATREGATGEAPAGERPDDALALETEIRQHLELALRATATRVRRLATWARVILPPDIQESVLELIARIKHRRQVYDTWGMGDALTTARGVTALFQGGPGTGKTLVASAIANELGMDLYRVDLSRIMSKWIGETEQNLAKLFDAAEDGHAIVLFDEADSLFAKRTEVKSSVDRYANLEVNYLLQRLDTFEGIAILTTNFGTSIDSAFKRRLSFRLTFPFPDEDAREQLWKTHLPAQLPRSGTFDFSELARRYQLSGGYIRNATLRAAFLAAEEQSPLTQEHLERAIRAEFREIGKIAESGVLE